MKLEQISTCISNFINGPWRIQWIRPYGDSGLGTISYKYWHNANHDAKVCEKYCIEGCEYNVVIDPGGAQFTVPP